MNTLASPEQILDRYRDAVPQELSDPERASIQEYLAQLGIKAVFGALPLQAHARFANIGFVTSETKSAHERIPNTFIGPYFFEGRYDPNGLMLYQKQEIPEE